MGEIINKVVMLKTLDGRRRCEKLERWAALVNKASISAHWREVAKKKTKREKYMQKRWSVVG